MKEREPERLESTSDDPLLRDLLASGRKELPEQAQLESVLAKLGPSLGGGGGGGGGAPMPHAATGLAGLGGAKVLGAVVVLAAAAWGVNQSRSRPDHPSPPAAHAPITVAPASEAPADAAPEIAPPAPSASIAPPASSSPPVVATPAASVRPPRPALPPAQDSQMEIKLLERAQDALFARPAEALTIIDEDVRRFPDGILRQEAEVIAIDALVRTGQRAPAEARAKRFRAAYPESTHLRRIETILAGAR